MYLQLQQAANFSGAVQLPPSCASSLDVDWNGGDDSKFPSNRYWTSLIGDWPLDKLLQLELGGSFMNGVLLQVVLLEGALPLEPLSVSLMTWTGDTPDGLWTVANFGSRVVVRGALGDSDWAGGSWALNLREGELQLMLAPVPEPATYGLMLAGLGLVAWLKRRRQSPAAAATR
jgi:hypothetical protein